ncbi:minor tail protein [Gordonia phage SallySpecial]|uniref:Minor tail protein n=1 Tax=Gordonia phage SallySpecial TaxID=2079570 RepID=A0A2P1CC36_9CAUD|nr:minor tail protein [Gordonia phage SallySpecial]AVJ48763.1 minor tail protein [Gordonia phage SallySpecial]
MSVNPRPIIALDGVFMSCATVTDADGTGPVLASNRPTLMDRLSITWGREDQWTQPDPAVLTFTLWEPQPGTWLNRIVTKTSMRRGCTIGYRHRDGTDRTIFQGFTTNVDVKATRQRTDIGVLDGWTVRIQCTDRSGFLGQVDWYAGQLPAETMQQRAVRIRNQGAGVGIRQVYFEDRFRTGTVRAVEVTDKSVLDTVNELYRSFADQWTYQQHRNVIIRIPSQTNWMPFGLRFGKATTDNRVRLFPPAQADPTGQESAIDRAEYPPASVSGADVSGDIVLSSNLIQDITKVTAKWRNDAAAGGAETATSTTIKADQPATLLEFETWYNDHTYVQPVLDDAVNMCKGDGAKPTHPQIRWNTKRTRGVPDWATFESITLPSQTIRLVALTGSPFAAALGTMPVWHPMGGVVAYEAGHWDVTLNLAPTSPELPPGHAPITCDRIDPRITLGDTNAWHLDPSITCFDLQFVGSATVTEYLGD